MSLKKLAEKIKNSLEKTGNLKITDKEKFINLSKDESFEVLMHLIDYEKDLKIKKDLLDMFLIKGFSNDNKLLLMAIITKISEKLNKS